MQLSFGKSGDSTAVQVLRDVSFSVPRGQFLAIVGPSGCGKTTILNILAGLIEQSSGSVLRDGESIGGPNRDTGYMLARSGLSPWRTARKNVELGLELRGIKRAERRERAMDLLAELDLERFADSYPAQLSQGMRQRVAIARTMVIRPKILLMDEPFGALDALTRMSVQSAFTRLWEHTLPTVLLVTHDLEEAVVMADRVIVMTKRPATIKLDLAIHLPRPRNIEELRFDSTFVDAQHELWNGLREEIQEQS